MSLGKCGYLRLRTSQRIPITMTTNPYRNLLQVLAAAVAKRAPMQRQYAIPTLLVSGEPETSALPSTETWYAPIQSDDSAGPCHGPPRIW